MTIEATHTAVVNVPYIVRTVISLEDKNHSLMNNMAVELESMKGKEIKVKRMVTDRVFWLQCSGHPWEWEEEWLTNIKPIEEKPKKIAKGALVLYSDLASHWQGFGVYVKPAEGRHFVKLTRHGGEIGTYRYKYVTRLSKKALKKLKQHINGVSAFEAIK